MILGQRGDSYDIMHFAEITTVSDEAFISAPLRVFIELTEVYTTMCVQYMPHLIDEMFSMVANEFPELIDKYSFSYRRGRHFTVMEEDEFIGEMLQSGQQISNSEIMKHKTHTILFTCDRGVSHEMVRHRPASFAQESTRYCNYFQNKFGNEITVIKPFFFEDEDRKHLYHYWERACLEAEANYFSLIKDGATPQEARSVLPNSLKTDLIVTANEHEWQHIVNLRLAGLTGSPHPQMKEVMGLCINDLVKESRGRISYEAD